MKRLLLLFLGFAVASISSYARPQYSILQSFGTKCQSCHVSPNVGMQRTNAGYLSRSSVSLINPESIGMAKMFDEMGKGKTLLDEKITFGMDLRYQNAKWNSPTKGVQTVPDIFDSTKSTTNIYDINPYATKRDNMLMTLQPYLTVKPIDEITINGSYNFAYDIEDKKYLGQQAYTASVTFKPAENLPALTVGAIQPAVGTDWDDHTMMVRQMILDVQAPPILSCDYIELGAQIDYEPVEWLGLTLGVFDSENLSKISGSYVSSDNKSYLAKATFYPSELPWGLTAFCGASAFVNGDLKTDDGLYFDNQFFSATSFFLHFGMGDKFAIMTEYMHIEMQNKYQKTYTETNNLSIEANYMVMEPIIAYARFENGLTHGAAAAQNKGTYKSNRYSLGAKIFLLPSVALLPEYKIYDRSHVDGQARLFACQLHVFF